LDDFEGLELTALDEYAGRVEPFDPRDDGYAAKLRSFFVSGGKRRLFIPLGPAALTPEQFRSRLDAALGDISFSAFILRRARSPLPPVLLFSAAAILTLILSGMVPEGNRAAKLPAHLRSRGAPPPPKGGFLGFPDSLFLLPLWVLLCREGSAGFVLSAILAILFRLLRDPVLELFISRHYRSSRSFLRDFRGRWLLSLIFIAAYMVIGIFCSLSPLTLLLGLSVFVVLGAQVLRTKLVLGLKRGHIRFVPIRISGSSRIPVPAPWFVLPFALASLGFLFFSLSQNPGAMQAELAGWEGLPLLNAADYAEHIQFQRSFSYLPLGDEDKPNRPYHGYILDSDGLIAGFTDDVGTVFAAGNRTGGMDDERLPPFPLTELMVFLEAYPHTEISDLSPRELFPLALILVLFIPLFLNGWHRHRKNGKLSIYIDKQIAA
jgi:hypothetical protein